MSDWIKNLKVGDKVFMSSRWGTSLRTVEKITSAGNIKVNGIMFNANGYERGGNGWNKCSLEEATHEAIQKYKDDLVIKKAHKLMSVAKRITLEQAIKIIEILGGEENG